MDPFRQSIRTQALLTALVAFACLMVLGAGHAAAKPKMLFNSILAIAISLVSLVRARPVEEAKKTCLPIVDLGYQLHQAGSFNVRNTLYFHSIPIQSTTSTMPQAHPTIGNRRLLQLRRQLGQARGLADAADYQLLYAAGEVPYSGCGVAGADHYVGLVK